MGFAVGDVHEAIAATRPDDECLVFRDRRLTWHDVTDRTRRLANHLQGQGLGCHVERAELQNSLKDELKIWLPKKAAEFASKFNEESDDQAKKTYARWWKDTCAICDSINAGTASREFD